ncbi:hypothetical protein V2J09_018872 [Rumex salicifolius]
MTSRGHPGPPRTLRHAPSLGSGSGVVQLVDASLPLELAEEKLAVEVERLASENHKLATAQIILRRDLICAQEEVQTVKAHIRSIQTESDIQIRVLLEKIAKMEADCKNAANVKKELEQAHKEAQRLVVARQELADKVENAKKDLNAVQMEIKQLPEVLTVLDSMKEEHYRLRSSFEYEKEVNMRKVEQLQAIEKEFISMCREVERLQTEVSNAEKTSQTPPMTAAAAATTAYGSQYQNPGPSHPVPAIQSNGLYYPPPYGMPPFQMGVYPIDGGTIPSQPSVIQEVEGMIPRPPSIPPVDETIPPPPPPPPDTPFDETIPPPPPYDPPPSSLG